MPLFTVKKEAFEWVINKQKSIELRRGKAKKGDAAVFQCGRNNLRRKIVKREEIHVLVFCVALRRNSIRYARALLARLNMCVHSPIIGLIRKIGHSLIRGGAHCPSHLAHSSLFSRSLTASRMAALRLGYMPDLTSSSSPTK